MERHRRNKNFRFWQTLKQGYDYFEFTRMPPKVAICNRRYHVNVDWRGGRPSPTGACPRFERPAIVPFWPVPGEEEIANQRIVVHGPKKRVFAHQRPIDRSTMYGLSKVPSQKSPRVQPSAAKQDPISMLIQLTKAPN